MYGYILNNNFSARLVWSSSLDKMFDPKNTMPVVLYTKISEDNDPDAEQNQGPSEVTQLPQYHEEIKGMSDLFW